MASPWLIIIGKMEVSLEILASGENNFAVFPVVNGEAWKNTKTLSQSVW